MPTFVKSNKVRQRKVIVLVIEFFRELCSGYVRWLFVEVETQSRRVAEDAEVLLEHFLCFLAKRFPPANHLRKISFELESAKTSFPRKVKLRNESGSKERANFSVLS